MTKGLIKISRDKYRKIEVTFPNNPVYVKKFKRINGKRWDPELRHWEFPYFFRSVISCLPESGVDLRYIQELLGHKSSKTTAIYTHVSKGSIGRIVSPLDRL